MPAKKKAAKPTLTYKKAQVEVLSSEVAFAGPLFRVLREEVREPGGDKITHRDVIRHNGSVVILPVLVLRSQRRAAAAGSRGSGPDLPGEIDIVAP